MDIFGNVSKLPGDGSKRKVNSKPELDFSYSDVSLNSLGKVESKTAGFSLFGIKTIVVLFFCLLVFKLFFLQVVEGEANQKLAEGNRIRPRVIEATRGLITDSSQEWLARNIPEFALALYPSDLPKNKSEREEVYNKLADLSGMNVSEIKNEAEANGLLSLDMVILKENLGHDEALILEKKITEIQGAIIAKRSMREYALFPGMPHILGYTSMVSEDVLSNDPSYLYSDRIGRSGIESQYEKYLKGKHGVEQIEVDSKGNIVRVLVQEGNQEPVPGNDVSLSIDKGLQIKTAEALQRGIEEGKKMTQNQDINSGVAIVMNVNTGNILSMVSLPDYDNNIFNHKLSSEDYKKLFEDESKPMFNRAVGGVYPPGSIIKIVMACAGLSENAISAQTSFDTPSEIKIGEYTFPDWKDHGNTDIRRAIAESNNIFFYAIGGGFDKIKGIGIENINKYWNLFGLGGKTGIDLPGEVSGLLPNPEWKKKYKNEAWYLGDTYHVSIGQGDLLVTPIQMIRITAAIANGGKLLMPQLVNKIISPAGEVIKESKPVIEKEGFIDPGVIKIVQEGMRMAVKEGSAKNLSDLPFSVAGKTGTAQFLNNQKTHAWFECYAPYENPEIAVIVLIDGGGGGHEIAAPVAKEILSYYFEQK